MSEEKYYPAYYANIPADVRYDKTLKPMARLLYGEITALTHAEGFCIASNSYFANLYECSEQSISNYIKQLKDRGYIVVQYVFNGTEITQRKIYLNVNSTAREIEEEQKKEGTKRTPLIERDPVNEIEVVEKEYLMNYKTLYERGIVKTEKPCINWSASRKITKNAINQYGVDLVAKAVRLSINSQFCVEKGYSLPMILSANVMNNILNSNEGNRKGFRTGSGIDAYVDDGVDF